MSEIKRWNVVELVDQFNHARRTADFYTTQPPSHVVSAADFDRVVQERDDWRGRWAAHERLIGRLVADAAELASERDTLARRVTELDRVIRAVEWRGHNGCCPMCNGWEAEKGRGETPGKHSENCELARLLQPASQVSDHRAVAAVAEAARAKANMLRTDRSLRKAFRHANEQAFALDHFASDLESGLWTDWLSQPAPPVTGGPHE